jgi:hypothetical protein
MGYLAVHCASADGAARRVEPARRKQGRADRGTGQRNERRRGYDEWRRSVQAPLVVDVSGLLHPGDNQISLAGFESVALEVQFTAEWYQTWGPKRPDKDLDMQIRYSTLDAAINDPVACDVVISRPAFRGYGMMIADVGLPPGAEVDRAVLEEIIGDWKNGVDSYEVTPDHVTFYVWPRAADVKFRFLFRPRFAMKARAARSLLYDFYNPDSQVVLAPDTFLVRR